MQTQAKKRGPLYPILKKIVVELLEHPSVWPFENPVSGVPDYYEVIKEPMDVSTLNEKVEEDFYETVEHFAKDTQKIFDNCRTYNEKGTPYTKHATKLEKFFKERLEVLKVEFGIK
jgi:histone acetyltransferase